jgi:transposase
VGDAAAGDGLRQRDDVLEASPCVDRSRRVAPPAAGVVEADPERGSHRLVAGNDGCFHGAGEKGGAQTGPNPTDRGKPGTKRHMVTDRQGLPLAELLTAANVNETTVLEALIDAVVPVAGKMGRPRRRPEKLHADKAYRSRKNQEVLRRRGIKSRIARPGIESSKKLGKHRRVVERTYAWVNQMRRLIIRYERRDDIYDAFFRLGCCLIYFDFLGPVLRRKLTAVERKQSSWAPQRLSTMVPSRRKAYNGLESRRSAGKAAFLGG